MGRELKVKGAMDLDRVAGYLNELASSMLAGTISVQKGNDSIVLKPVQPLWVEIEAEEGKTKQTISVEVSWMPTGLARETDDLVISSEPPAATPAEVAELEDSAIAESEEDV